MAGYTIRSLAQLAAEATGAFVQSVQGTATKLWPNVWRIESKVLALIGFEMEQRRAWLVRQLFASTADRVWLIRHGFEYGLQPTPASTAMGTASAAAAAGTVVPAGLQYARGDGTTYSTVARATASGTSVSLALEADVAGSAGNTSAGMILTLVNPDDAPLGLGKTCTVDSAEDGTGLSGGSDEQDLEAFRAEVLYRKRNPPQGGLDPGLCRVGSRRGADGDAGVRRQLPERQSFGLGAVPRERSAERHSDRRASGCRSSLHQRPNPTAGYSPSFRVCPAPDPAGHRDRRVEPRHRRYPDLHRGRARGGLH